MSDKSEIGHEFLWKMWFVQDDDILKFKIMLTCQFLWVKGILTQNKLQFAANYRLKN